MEVLAAFREVYVVDFEFTAHPGERQVPLCQVALELKSGGCMRFWEDDLQRLAEPPYPVADTTVLFVGYYLSAEIGCHLALSWPVPAQLLDLYVEFRNLSNGRVTPCGNSLLGALTYWGLDGIEATEKDRMQQLAVRGGPYTNDERQALLEYCEQDVRALAKLLPRMLPQIDLPRALQRGRYMAAAAHIEYVGVPIDAEAHKSLVHHWARIQEAR